MNKYVPELGQRAFGNVYDAYELPDEFVPMLQVLMNTVYPDDNDYIPFDNGVFEMRLYDWGDCICDGEDTSPTCGPCKPNFKYGEIEVRWYKYLGRGTTINRYLNQKEFTEIFMECMRSIT